MSKILLAPALRRMVGPLIVASFGVAFTGVAVWSVAGAVAMGSSMDSTSNTFLPKPHFYAAANSRTLDLPKTDKTARHIPLVSHPVVAASVATGPGKSTRKPIISVGARFDKVAAKAELTSEKLASLFEASSAAEAKQAEAKLAPPVSDRLASIPASPTYQPQTLLAYADSSPNGAAGAALSSLLQGPSEEYLAALANRNEETDDTIAVLPDYEFTPAEAPRPQLRPLADQAPRPTVEKADAQPKADAPKVADKPEPQKLAYARPDEPTERKSGGNLGQTLRNMFGGGVKAGNGVAVYDISAAKVYMPDGSILEAHSGIGKMADNPDYVHVKMNGPTPPHTYNLKMRETRFHGVEAIRMLPVDGKNKFGRDGFLTHSYLLRGGRAESHGCVAFEDYERFLTAFKRGKVKQLVVVPSGGKASMIASNGRSI